MTRNRLHFLLILGLLLGAQPVATDLYLPALPALSQDLGPAGLSLTLFMLAFGCGQLLWGRAADSFGRRPVLLAGLAAYAVTALGAALSPSLWLLVLFRAGQGMALAAIIVCARAAVRDLYPPHEGPRVMAAGLGGLGVVALLAPVLGAHTVAAWGWRATLLLVAGYAVLAAALCSAWFKETRPPTPAAKALALPLRTLVRNPHFRGWALLSGTSFAGFFCFLVCSPAIYIQGLGVATTLYGWVPASCSLVYIGSVMLCRRLLQRHSPVWLVRRAAAFSLAGGLVQWGAALAWPHNPWPLLAGQWLYACGHGMHQPCGQAGAVSDFPAHAGQAVAWSGFGMMALAFVAGQAASAFLVASGPLAAMSGSPAWPIVVGTVVAGGLLNLIAWRGLRA